MQFLDETKKGTVADDHNELRRSKRIIENQVKKDAELQQLLLQLQNEKKSATKNSHRCRARSKSVASERAAPTKGRSEGGRRCVSRSKSTECGRKTKLPPNVPARRSSSDTKSSTPKSAHQPASSGNNSRSSESAERDRKTKLPSKVPARRSLFDSSTTSSSPKSAHQRSQSASSGSSSHSSKKDSSTAPKSNLKSAHRCLHRSKSVTFEVDRSRSSPDHQSLVVDDVPIDLSVQSPVARQSTVMPNAADNTLPSVPSPQSSGELASDVQLAYENRIDNLVQSNTGKINRIKELMAENHALSEQVNTLHRLNKSLAGTVDAFLAEPNTSANASETAARVVNLENEIENLRGRVNRLNRENFELRSTNDRLKSSLATHSQQVLDEHNYNM